MTFQTDDRVGVKLPGGKLAHGVVKVKSSSYMSGKPWHTEYGVQLDSGLFGYFEEDDLVLLSDQHYGLGLNKCECGADAVGHPGHSPWCRKGGSTWK